MKAIVTTTSGQSCYDGVADVNDHFDRIQLLDDDEHEIDAFQPRDKVLLIQLIP